MPIRWGRGTKGLKIQNPADYGDDQNSLKLPSLTAASQDAAAAANEGNIYYDETGNAVMRSDGTSWNALTTTAAVSMDGAYNNGSSVAVDTGDVDFVFTVNKDFSIINNAAATQAIGLKIDAANAGAGCVITDGIAVTTSGAAASVVDALDMSDAGITNALNIGANDIVGTTGKINLNNFDVAATGEVTSADDVNCVNVVASGDLGGDTASITTDATVGGTLDVTGVATFTVPPFIHGTSSVVAGTATVDVPAYSMVYSVATDNATDCTLTLDGSAVVGYDFTMHFITDGTHDVVVACEGADTIDAAGDLANTSITFVDAGDYCVLRKVSSDKWIVIVNNGGTLA